MLGERYYYQELCEMHSSLILLKDRSQKKNNLYVGVTETHLLTFRECESKYPRSQSPLRHAHTIAATSEKEVVEVEEPESTLNQLLLVSAAEMQCIDTIYYRENEKVIRLMYKKYKSIKLYH